ncbi:alkylglycerol monooxygenase isoform X2 [Anguilla rostrata]|uniref:alkylglycerol monooxygenase isoform X2 n=1 Tax=Anguilla rostrata TaxID=7938 RepID=UPI0030D12FE5
MASMEVETPSITLNQVARTMFYLVTPNETSFQHVEEVPDYVDKATPIFLGMLVLELVLGWAKTGSLVIRINDGVTSVSAGLLSRLPLLFLRSLELSSYIYIWNNHRLLELPWDSPWTWWLAFLGVDLAYYWFHRFSHELNILWAAHQAHHSSEEYNLSTALRQSSTQQFASWILHLPLALAVPPTVFAVHIQFNLLYQFWIHTEVIRHLGPLEWVMNTPSHHRVHHGRNRYCIDKNYAGTLIIWDRIFGTFAPEGDKVVYGLTKQIKSFDPIYVQVTVKEVPYNPTLPVVLQAYVLLQFLLLLAVYTDVMAMKLILSQQTLLLLAGYIIFTLTSFGLIIDRRPNAAVVEMFRCALLLGLYRFGYMKVAVPSMPFEVFICLSVLYWALQTLSKLANGKNKQH